MARPTADVPVTRKREFWVLVGHAAALGVFGAFAGLVSLGAIKFGGRWGADSQLGWFGGHWWWVGVTAAAGVGSWLAQRRGLGKENLQVNTLAGIAGIFGGLFSSPVIVVMPCSPAAASSPPC